MIGAIVPLIWNGLLHMIQRLSQAIRKPKTKNQQESAEECRGQPNLDCDLLESLLLFTVYLAL